MPAFDSSTNANGPQGREAPNLSKKVCQADRQGSYYVITLYAIGLSLFYGWRLCQPTA